MKKPSIQFTTLKRNESLDGDVILVNKSHISLLDSNKFQRNETVKIRNALSGKVSYVRVRGSSMLKKNTIELSYELATLLNISNISDSFGENKSIQEIDIDLMIGPTNPFIFLYDDLKSSNTIIRWLAIFGIVDAFDTLNSVGERVFNIGAFLIKHMIASIGM